MMQKRSRETNKIRKERGSNYEEGIEDFKRFIKRNKNKEVAIIMHHNADSDALCSSIAMAELLRLKGVFPKVYAPAGISKQARKLLHKYPYEIIESERIKEKNIIIIDTSSFLQLGENIKIKKDAYIIVVDHHEHAEPTEPKEYQKDEKKRLYKRANIAIINEEYSSTARIVYDIYRKLKEKINKQVSLFLIAGILGDTNFLKYANTEDIKIVYNLLTIGKWKGMKEFLFLFSETQDNSSKGARIKALERLELEKVKGLWVGFTRVGSHEADVARGLVSYGLDIAFVLNTSQEGIRISGRCIDSVTSKLGKGINNILKSVEECIEGECGGHPTAASCNGKRLAESWNNIKNKILREIEKSKCAGMF